MTRFRVPHLLLDISRWFLLGILIYAPWAYGCTTPTTLRALCWAMNLTGMVFFGGCLLSGRMPAVHPVLKFSTAWILLQGWFMTWNAGGAYAADTLRFIPVTAPLPGLPGSVDAATSAGAMWRISGLLVMSWMANDLAAQEKWRNRVLAIMGFTAVAVIGYGLVERMMHTSLFFQLNGPAGARFFGTFYYHGNAGAFINLTLPVVAVLAFRLMRDPTARGSGALWVPGLLICFAGAVVNVSKAAMVVSLMVAFLLSGWLFRYFREQGIGYSAVGYMLCGVFLALLVAALVGWEQSVQRWREFPTQLHLENNRLLVALVTWHMSVFGGLFGLGPGTFEIAFPQFSSLIGDRAPGRWRFAHEDYLQMMAEWGFLGAMVWGGCLFFGIFTAFRHGLRRFPGASTQQQAVSFAVAVSLFSIAVHALVDFPLQIASLQLYVAVLYGLAVREWGRRRKVHPAPEVGRNAERNEGTLELGSGPPALG